MPRKTTRKPPPMPTYYTVELTVLVGKTRNKKRIEQKMEVDVFATSPESAVLALARKLHIDPVFED